MQVRNMFSSRGNKVANQFIIEGDGIAIFQSYESTIAKVDYNKREIEIYKDWDYSPTTGKYRNAFFDDYFSPLNNKKAIERAFEIAKINGYALINSNHGAYGDGRPMAVYFDYTI